MLQINNMVSIIMPAFNVGDYIAESIKSVQKQLYENWELIVINDGSTDDTHDVVNAISRIDPRVILFDQENSGVSAARNKGLSAAKGKYIAFLDSDDLWEPGFLSELITAKNQRNVEMAYCGYNHFYKGGYSRPYRYQYPSGWILPEAIQGSVRLHICALVVEKSLLDEKNIRFTEGCAIGEDQEFILKIITTAEVQSVSKNLMLYRVRPGSAITSAWNWQKHIDAITAHKRAIDFILQEYKSSTAKLDKLVPMLHDSLAQKIFKFLWRMIKNGYHEEALYLMNNNNEFSGYLVYLNKKTLSLVDRLKYAAIVSKNQRWWRFLKIFKIM